VVVAQGANPATVPKDRLASTNTADHGLPGINQVRG
jgi:hypothetical protein